ncbi:MAG: efflux RND transporter permease subunit, partial [Pseudomonadota bacterium]
MSALETGLPKWVLSHRLLVIALSVLCVYVLGYGTTKLAFDTSYRVIFSEDNPELLAFERIEETYIKDDNVQLIIAPQDGDIFTRKTLEIIEGLTNEAWQTPFSNRVDSITNFQFTEAEEDDLIVCDMVKNATDLSDKALLKVKQEVLAEPTILGRLISRQGHVSAINVTVQLSPEERTDATQKIMAHVRQMAAEVREQHPDISTYITGMVPYDQAFLESAVYDSSVLFPIALALMVICLALLAGGFFGTLVTVLVIFMSVVAAMGAGGHLGFPLTGSSTSVPIIILTVAVANAVHVLVTFNHEYRKNRDKHSAMFESLRVNLQPVMLASVTTAIGFMTMNFSEVPPFQHLGTQVAVGVLMSFLLTISFLPALLTMMPVKPPKEASGQGTW